MFVLYTRRLFTCIMTKARQGWVIIIGLYIKGFARTVLLYYLCCSIKYWFPSKYFKVLKKIADYGSSCQLIMLNFVT